MLWVSFQKQIIPNAHFYGILHTTTSIYCTAVEQTDFLGLHANFFMRLLSLSQAKKTQRASYVQLAFVRVSYNILVTWQASNSSRSNFDVKSTSQGTEQNSHPTPRIISSYFLSAGRHKAHRQGTTAHTYQPVNQSAMFPFLGHGRSTYTETSDLKVEV